MNERTAFLPALAAGLAASFSPSEAAAQCATGRPAPAGRPITVPIELANNHVFVRMCWGTRQFWFILDTGSGNTILDLAAAQAAGVPLGQRIEVRGAGSGSVSGAMVDGVSLTLADAPGVTLPVAMAVPLTHIAAHEGRPVPGILGYDFISRFVMSIDYHQRVLRLYEPSTFRYDGVGTRLPITLSRNHPHVRAEVVLADGGRVAGDFVVDVGSGLALLLTSPLVRANRLLGRVGPTIRVAGGRGVGGETVADVGRVASLRIGALEIAGPVTRLFGDSAGVFSTSEYFEGNIGGDILRRFTVYFDYGRKEMIFEANPDRGEPFEADMSGAGFTTDGDFTRLLVDDVLPGSPAAEAGLELGDTIVAVNGRPAGVVTLDGLRRLMYREGARVELSVRRDGVPRSVRVTLRRLV